MKITAKWLFKDDAGIAGAFVQAGLTKVVNYRRHQVGRDGEVEEAVAARAAFMIEAVKFTFEVVIPIHINQIRSNVEYALGKTIPDFLLNLARSGKFVDCLPVLLLEFPHRCAGGAQSQ